MKPYKVFGLAGSKNYAESICCDLGVKLTPHEEKNFEDDECYVKPSDGAIGNVRGHNVFVIQSLYSDEKESVNDKLMKLCMMCGALKDASASEVIVVIPYLAFSRQDRKTASRAPITTKYIAKILEACGVDRGLFIDVHNLAAEQNAFNIPIDNLEARNLFAEHCAQKLFEQRKIKNLKVLSPDSGGLGRCERFRNALIKNLIKLGGEVDDVEIVVFDKLRIKGEVVGGRIIGDVKDSDVIVYDDMISTASTMKKACDAVFKEKGRIFAVCATHGVFCDSANVALDKIDTNIVITDTVIPWRLNASNLKKIHVVKTGHLVSDAIKRIHDGTGSISELLN